MDQCFARVPFAREGGEPFRFECLKLGRDILRSHNVVTAFQEPGRTYGDRKGQRYRNHHVWRREGRRPDTDRRLLTEMNRSRMCGRTVISTFRLAPHVQSHFSMTKTYDAIIIGTGQAGPFLAQRLAGTGMKVAIIERKLFGGTCVNTGCTPTTAMVASAYAAHMVRRAADFEWLTMAR